MVKTLNNASKVLKFAADRADEFSDLAETEITKQLRSLLDRSLAGLLELVVAEPTSAEQIQNRLLELADDFKRTGTDGNDPVRELEHARNAVQLMSQVGENSPITDELRTSLIHQILLLIQETIPTAVRAVCRNLVVAIFRRDCESSIRSAITKMKNWERDFQKSTDSLIDHVKDIHAENAVKQSRLANGSVPFEGLSVEQVLGCIAEQLGSFENTVDLVSEQLRKKLVDFADREHPAAVADRGAATTLSTLLLKLPPNKVCWEYLALIHDLIAKKMTVYKLIQHRTGDVAEQLFRLATPLVHLGGRNVSQLNIEPTETLVVALPATFDRVDIDCMEKLKRAIQELFPKASFTDAMPSETDISVTRFIAGFPASSMTHTADEAHSYYESALRGHLPHIPGIVSVDGKIVKSKGAKNAE